MQSVVSGLFNEYRRQAEVKAQAQAGLLEDDDSGVNAEVNEYSSFRKKSISTLNAQRKKAKTASELDSF